MNPAFVFSGLFLAGSLIFAAVAMTVKPFAQADAREIPGLEKIRRDAMAVNTEFIRLLPAPQIINVGRVANDGTGDTLHVGMEKIVENLRAIPTPAAPAR